MSQDQDLHAWFSQGSALYELRRYEGAIARFDRLLEVNPKNHDAWMHRGYALYESGRMKKRLPVLTRR
ncbi:MAG: tetratricopeptide repeat protein [Leptolyngbyaceae cyanobacterium RM2_2_4]|nr:tetratricopeptide repeat protein [Leptolyngbyaceae cyanobacterium RM2_2_4]